MQERVVATGFTCNKRIYTLRGSRQKSISNVESEYIEGYLQSTLKDDIQKENQISAATVVCLGHDCTADTGSYSRTEQVFISVKFGGPSGHARGLSEAKLPHLKTLLLANSDRVSCENISIWNGIFFWKSVEHWKHDNPDAKFWVDP